MFDNVLWIYCEEVEREIMGRYESLIKFLGAVVMQCKYVDSSVYMCALNIKTLFCSGRAEEGPIV